MSMLHALIKAHKEQSAKDIAKKKEVKKLEKKAKQHTEFDWNILTKGGESIYTINIKEFKDDVDVQKEYKVNVSVSVEGVRIAVSKYKFHIRDAQGNRVYFKAKSYKVAQAVCDEIFGKGHYRVSGTVI